MARRYARDNKGRFASAGTGATARGGRLRTAAGNKRATVKANPGVSSGRISSVPKGAIGKTGSARSANQISRGTSSEQRTAYKKQRAEAKARKTASKTPTPKSATPTTAQASKLGSRLNPAKQANRAATRQYDKAYERENRIRAALFKGEKTAKKRDSLAKELNKASNMTATKLQQRREIRAQFGVQTKDKARRVAASKLSGTISKNKDVRNKVNRREAFKRKVTRAGALSRPGENQKARRTERIRAKAMATYQGARRPEISDATVGGIKNARKSPAFKAPATRLPAPSRAAQRQGRALAASQTKTRDAFGRQVGNPKKMQRKIKTARRALEFYKNPKEAAKAVVQSRGKQGLSTKGFRKPR